MINLLNIGGARKYLALGSFIGEEAILIPVSLAEIPSLHQLGTGTMSFAAVMNEGQC